MMVKISDMLVIKDYVLIVLGYKSFCQIHGVFDSPDCDLCPECVSDYLKDFPEMKGPL